MPFIGKKECSPFGYISFRTIGSLIKKTAKFSLVATAFMELSLRAVDFSADISGYNDQYTNNSAEIINELESELKIDVPETRISSSFADARSVMMNTDYNAQSILKQDYSLADYVQDYYEDTYYALIMNSHIASLFDQEDRTVAIYGNNTICLAPFDNSTEFTQWERLTIAHELMHSYVNSINNNMYDVKTKEEYIARLTIDEGIAMYASDLVYNGSAFTELAKIIAPRKKNLFNKFNQYILGANFVALAVDRIGLSAITIIAKNPPSSFEEIINPEEYLDWLEANKDNFVL